MTTAWQSWIHLENLSAYHDVPFATKENGFGGVDTELAFNSPLQVTSTSRRWVIGRRTASPCSAGRRNEGGANFRAGECALFTESSAGYAGIKEEAHVRLRRAPVALLGGCRRRPSEHHHRRRLSVGDDGQTEEEYKGVAEFLNFLSSPEIQSKWHQDTGYLPITLGRRGDDKGARLLRGQSRY